MCWSIIRTVIFYFDGYLYVEFDDSHSITEADGEVSVVAVADSTQLSDEAECSDASSDQLDEEAQPGSGCGELPSGLQLHYKTYRTL